MKFNKLIPELSVSNFEESLEFYKNLGFKIDYTRKNFAMLSFQGSQIMIEQTNDHWKTGELEKPFGRGINFQIDVDNLNKILKKINKPLFRDAEINEYTVGDKFIRQKEFLIQDPDGYLLRFAQEL